MFAIAQAARHRQVTWLEMMQAAGHGRSLNASKSNFFCIFCCNLQNNMNDVKVVEHEVAPVCKADSMVG
jgi:hypothetical protein